MVHRYIRNIHTGIPLDNLQIVLPDVAAASTTTSLINMHPTSATHVFIPDIKKVGNKTQENSNHRCLSFLMSKGENYR